jgi:hypothetical protein
MSTSLKDSPESEWSGCGVNDGTDTTALDESGASVEISVKRADKFEDVSKFRSSGRTSSDSD